MQALFPEQINQGVTEQLKEIAVDKIKIAPRQPRQIFDPEKLAELAESIKELGVIQPVVVRPDQDGGYELIAGERRWRACKMLGHKTIPAVIKDYHDLEATAVALIENIQRENLNPLEEALAYQQLMEEFNLTQEEVSERVSRFTIDSNIAFYGNEQVVMDTCPVIRNDRTMLPVRYAAESLGAKVDWEQSTQTVIIETGL